MNNRTIILMKMLSEDNAKNAGFDMVEVARLVTSPASEQQQLRDVASVASMTGLIAYEQRGKYTEAIDLSNYLN